MAAAPAAPPASAPAGGKPAAAAAPAAKVAEAPASEGRMTPPAGTRPPGSPPATKDAPNRMAKFLTEPGKPQDGPDIAPTAAQQQQKRADEGRKRPPVERPKAKEEPAGTAKEIPKDLTQAAKEKTAEQEGKTKVTDPPLTEGETGETQEVLEKKAGYLTDKEAEQSKSGPLARHYKNVKKENMSLKAQLAKAREAAEKNPEVGKLTETLKQREERLAQVEQELRYTNFEASEEFKTNYWAPYEKAFQEGRALATELLVREQKDDLGEVVQPGRVGTPEDFDRIVGEENTARAAKLAQDLFGEVQGAEIMRARREVRKLNTLKEEAREKYKKEGGEIFKRRQEDFEKTRAVTAKAFENGKKAGAEKYPQWFGEVDGDTEINAVLAKGMAFADACFSGKVKNADGTERQLSQVELAEYQAAMRNRAGAFERLVREQKRAQDRIRELETKLKEFEESRPGPGDGADAPLGGREETDTGPKNSRAAVARRMSRFVT